jgi:hypothetical protein
MPESISLIRSLELDRNFDLQGLEKIMNHKVGTAEILNVLELGVQLTEHHSKKPCGALHSIPMILLRRQALVKEPLIVSMKTLLASLRSSAFLSAYVTVCMS